VKKNAILGGWVAVVLIASGAAHAQGTSSETAAVALFDEGRKLMAQGKFAEACPKLAESERLAPNGGTLLNLAECYEKNGQTASAWVALKDVAARANAVGKADVEKRALARAAALEPNLARLTVVVPAASDVPGLEVKRDGVTLGHAEFGVAIPVDPGAHLVEATAPQKKKWTAQLTVAAKDASARVTLALEDNPDATPPATTPPPTAPTSEPPPATPAAPEQPPSSGGSTQRTIGLVVGAVGLAGVALGSYFGLAAKSKNDDALQNCRTSTLCSSTGLSLTDDAKNDATISTIAFAAGGVALVTGVVLFLTAPSSSAPAAAGKVHVVDWAPPSPSAPLLSQKRYGPLMATDSGDTSDDCITVCPPPSTATLPTVPSFALPLP
jgi:tetratricopeptide (TPR) repeat protein